MSMNSPKNGRQQVFGNNRRYMYDRIILIGCEINKKDIMNDKHIKQQILAVNYS